MLVLLFNILNNVSTQYNTVYNKGLVTFRRLDVKAVQNDKYNAHQDRELIACEG